jgi:hypothetical protein
VTAAEAGEQVGGVPPDETGAAAPSRGTSGPPPLTRWLPIPGYEGRYEVSDDGQVRNQTRLLKLHRTNKRYWQVGLCAGGRSSNRLVHHLMLEAFVGPRPPGLLALHADDDRDNNTLPNLRWGTYSENAFDRIRNGNHNHADKTHCKWGHPFEGENLMVFSTQRACRACAQRRLAEFRARQRQARAA